MLLAVSVPGTQTRCRSVTPPFDGGEKREVNTSVFLALRGDWGPEERGSRRGSPSMGVGSWPTGGGRVDSDCRGSATGTRGS